MPKSKKLKRVLAAVSFFIAACFIFLCYFIFTNYLTERDRQDGLTVWESQREILSEESVVDSYEDVDEDYTIYNTTPDKVGKEGSSKLTPEYFFPLKLSIPKIDLEWVSYEGADSQTLEQGPGHIEETPLPGDTGRCTISGHRTTYGSPFLRVNELEDGDLIYLETISGELFIYVVTGQNIVNPEDVYILEGSYKKELLLTACHPKYSGAKRLIIIAELLNLYSIDIGSSGSN